MSKGPHLGLKPPWPRGRRAPQGRGFVSKQDPTPTPECPRHLQQFLTWGCGVSSQVFAGSKYCLQLRRELGLGLAV